MLRFYSLTVELHLLQSPLGHTEIFFGTGQIELQLYKIDFRFAALLCQFFHARDQLAARSHVILPEFYFAFCLLDFGLLDLELRSISSLRPSQAFFFCT